MNDFFSFDIAEYGYESHIALLSPSFKEKSRKLKTSI